MWPFRRRAQDATVSAGSGKDARDRPASGQGSRTESAIAAIDWIERHAVASPGSVAMIDLASGRRYSYRQMNERVGRVAAYLSKIGIRPGDRVGVLMQNSTDIVEIVFGVWRIGAACVALNFRLTGRELAYIVNDSGTDVIFFDRSLQPLVDDIRTNSAVKRWVLTDGVGGKTPYERALADVEPHLCKVVSQSLGDLGMLLYSSGTTGQPKGVIITHRMMLFSAINVAICAQLSSDTVNLATMPLFHIGAINGFCFPALFMGGTVVVQRSFEPAETLATINDRELGITHFLGVPAIYNALRVHPDNEKTDFTGLQVAVAGAETVPDSLIHWWRRRGVRIQEAYGMTETAAGISLLSREDVPAKVGSAGKAMMFTQVRVVRTDNNQEAAVGELGELWVRGPNVTPGYWNRPEADAESFVDGWLRSGDIGRIDEDGYLYIEDRLKDMYISGGENVYPAEVENILYGMSQIAEVAVIGVPDRKWGEAGCAVVVLNEQATLSLEDVALFCQGKLASYKIPAYLVIVDTLPRNATGKVLKPELRKSIPEKLNLL